MSLVTAIESEYKDLDLSLKPHPERGDILPLRDVAAIKNAIKNILNTRPGEKPFNSNFGCNLFGFLFEPDDIITRAAIRKSIVDSLSAFEPRFTVTEVLVNSADNAYNITISGTIINSQRDIDINLLIKRFS
jgi:phage baseplate assembly protein W